MRQSRLWNRLSELHARYNLVKVGTDIAQLLGRNLVSLLISLSVASLLTSIFSRAEYGSYQFTIEIFSALGFISLPGLVQVVVQETAKGNHGALEQALKIRLKVVLPYGLVLLALAAYYQFIAKQLSLALSFAMISVAFPLKSALDCYRSYLLGRRDYALYTRIPVTVQICVALATAATAWITRNPILTLGISGLVEACCHLVAYRYTLSACPPANTQVSPNAMRFGLGLSGVNILPSISSRMDTMVVGTTLSIPQVAVLSLGSIPLEKSKLLVSVLGEFFTPRVLSQKGANLFRRSAWIMLIYFTIILAYVLGVVIVLPFFFRIFFPKYMDVVPLAILGMFSLVASAPAGIMELTLLSQERLTQTGALRVAQFIFDVVVLVTCTQIWGVTGAFISRLLSNLWRTILVTIFYIKNRREALALQEK
jgi:O-antigen/teichoic acid export membrane protein